MAALYSLCRMNILKRVKYCVSYLIIKKKMLILNHFQGKRFTILVLISRNIKKVVPLIYSCILHSDIYRFYIIVYAFISEKYRSL